MNEVNFDGLVGPTHIYGGLSYGNLASSKNAQRISNPKLAAHQGLDKMRLLMELGIPQAVLPPAARPNWHLLRTLGCHGDAQQMLKQAFAINPNLLSVVYSAASMWAANAATISPSCDTDGTVHITPANLSYNLHRAQESAFNYKLFKQIFNNEKYFTVHTPLPDYRDLSDEGAANHSVLCSQYTNPGLELFVYGRTGLDDEKAIKHKFIGRQTKLASTANALQHKLDADKTIFLAQSSAAIDAGVFHNDVVFVANKNVMLYHAQAFAEWASAKETIAKFFNNDCYFIGIDAAHLSLEQAVATYLFNSQLVSTAAGMVLIAPYECSESVAARRVIEKIVSDDNPIVDVKFVQCRQSMQNGGGPACLRLRAILTKDEQAAVAPSVMLTPELYNRLYVWVEKHYRDRLSPEDLLDPALAIEVQYALEELTITLSLGNLYDFQNQ